MVLSSLYLGTGKKEQELVHHPPTLDLWHNLVSICRWRLWGMPCLMLPDPSSSAPFCWTVFVGPEANQTPSQCYNLSCWAPILTDSHFISTTLPTWEDYWRSSYQKESMKEWASNTWRYISLTTISCSAGRSESRYMGLSSSYNLSCFLSELISVRTISQTDKIATCYSLILPNLLIISPYWPKWYHLIHTSWHQMGPWDLSCNLTTWPQQKMLINIEIYFQKMSENL